LRSKDEYPTIFEISLCFISPLTRDFSVDEKILNIVQHHNIHEQNDLKEHLKTKGCDIPQATLSRRLKKLKIVKIDGIYRPTESQQSHRPLIIDIKISESGLVVLHTPPGQAGSLAYFLDQKYVKDFSKDHENLEILGTIAGDDTVLVILSRNQNPEHILYFFQQDFPYLTQCAGFKRFVEKA
jgi:transcriptional regulator of arginine metabolism